MSLAFSERVVCPYCGVEMRRMKQRRSTILRESWCTWIECGAVFQFKGWTDAHR
jgi:hypothetical protein